MTAPTQQSDRFGAFGGRYVPETLIPALDELEARVRRRAQADPAFRAELSTMLSDVRRAAVAAERRAAPVGARRRAACASSART